MTFSVTQYGITVSSQDDHDDLDAHEVIERLRGLMLAIGYDPYSVDQALADVAEGHQQ